MKNITLFVFFFLLLIPSLNTIAAEKGIVVIAETRVNIKDDLRLLPYQRDLIGNLSMDELRIWTKFHENFFIAEKDPNVNYCDLALLNKEADKKFLETLGGKLTNYPPGHEIYDILYGRLKNTELPPESLAAAKKYGILPPDPTPNSLLAKLSSLKKFAKENLGYILAGTALLSYSVVLFKLFRDAQYTKNEDAWFTFEESYMTPESFILAPHEETRATLLRAIEKRYQTDSAQAVQAFMSDTKKEMTRLKNFISWHEWLVFLMLDAIFPDQNEAQHKAKTNLIKLEYMRSLFETE